jgi:hypothetical protein
MRDEAYKAYDLEAQNAWRGDNNIESAPDCQTGSMPMQDAREAAYAAYDKEMAEAWRNAR